LPKYRFSILIYFYTNFQVTAPPQENGHPDNRPSVKDSREYYLEDDECPLAILMNHPPSRGNGLINAALMWYYCAVTGESKKIVFTSGATKKITSGGATSDFWSPHK
jgi:hypothetical protein